MNQPSQLRIRAVSSHDHEQWQWLFAAYRDFYCLLPDPTVIATVWEWTTNPDHELEGIVACTDERLVGIAHFRPFTRPSTGSVGLWLDDLYADPEHRRRGVGEALIQHIRYEAATRGASLVRWITAADNTTAQSLYESVAQRTTWVTYDATPSCASGPGVIPAPGVIGAAVHRQPSGPAV